MTRHELLRSHADHRHLNQPHKKTNTFVPPKDALIEENCIVDVNNEYNVVLIGMCHYFISQWILYIYLIGPFYAGPYWRYFFVVGVIRVGVRRLN